MDKLNPHAPAFISLYTLGQGGYHTLFTVHIIRVNATLKPRANTKGLIALLKNG